MRIENYIRSNELENKFIFLSASFPKPERDERYFNTANPLEITDAIISVARAVFSRKGKLVFGGHPTISPLILSVGEEFIPFFEQENDLPIVYIYQSELFKGVITEYTLKLVEKKIGQIKWIPAIDNDREKSLYIMRKRMIEEITPIAAIFIGGMEGVEDEFRIFVEMYPKNHVYPIGSTGGAAKTLLEEKIMRPMEMQKWSFKWKYKLSNIPDELNKSMIYPSLVNEIISDFSNFHDG